MVTAAWLSTPNAASQLGKRDRETGCVSTLTLTSRLRCCYAFLLIKERIQAWFLPPRLPPSSTMSVDGEGREHFVILLPGQLLAEEVSDKISAYRHSSTLGFA